MGKVTFVMKMGWFIGESRFKQKHRQENDAYRRAQDIANAKKMRQILIRRALELDDPPLSAADKALIAERLAEHHADPSSSVPPDELKRRLIQNRER